MESNYFYNISEENSINEYLKSVNKNTLFIYSPTSIVKTQISNKKLKMENWHNISKNINKINQYINEINGVEEIVTFGGGSTIDIGKYISYKLGVNYTCIPSMLSTNSYATNKVALMENGKKITLEAKMPSKIVIDNEILKLSKDENLYGLVDVLSIYTALYDWKIAEDDINEKIDEDIFNQANNLLQETLKFIENNTLENITEDIMKLFELIGIAGYITNLYGNGRPESGSEHIMAKEIERKIAIPHGISVSIGILIMELLQGRENKEIIDSINKMRILKNGYKYGLSKEIIKSSFLELKPRDDRYTIINRYKEDIDYKKKIIEDFFSIIDKGYKIC